MSKNNSRTEQKQTGLNKKIVLYIQQARQGLQAIYPQQQAQSGESLNLWNSVTGDLREVIDKMSLPEDTPFHIIKYNENAISVITGFEIAGRDGDYRAAWQLIPKEILCSVQDDVPAISEKLLTLMKREDADDVRIYEAVDKSFKSYPYHGEVVMHPALYEKATEVNTIRDGKSNSYAVIYYDPNTLEALLNPQYLLHPNRLQYKGVVLLPKGIKGRLPEISGKDRTKTVLVKLDKNIPRDVSVGMMSNNKVIPLAPDTSYIRCETEELQLVYSRRGYADIQKTHTVKGTDGIDSIGAEKLDWKISISRDMFVVTDEDNNKVERFELEIQGKKVNGPLSVSEDEAKNLSVRIFPPFDKKASLQNYESKLNILNQKIVHVKLSYIHEDHVYLAPSAVGKTHVKIPMPDERAGQWKSPVKGYKLVSKGNSREPKGLLKPHIDYLNWKILLPIIAAAIIGMGLGMLISPHKHTVKGEQQTNSQSANSPCSDNDCYCYPFCDCH